ncbi:unnamed protein product [Parnassius mnemosyne]|uniref:Uncharacterized protein n=1 Tax=Parnassius mnemosyne TaxID=213953 RepID=A0AAV1KQK5_9NEOP
MSSIPLYVYVIFVLFTEDVTFRTHIVQVCKKAFKNLGFLLRQTHDFLNTAAVKSFYNALVRNNLETSAIIWNPYEPKYSLMLEKIQNKFTRYLYLRQYGVYPFIPLMYPTLCLIGMVGYYKLGGYIFMILRVRLNNPEILKSLRFLVSNPRLRQGAEGRVAGPTNCSYKSFITTTVSNSFLGQSI